MSVKPIKRVNKKSCANLKRGIIIGIIFYKEKGRQDRDGIHEAWLMNRFEHAETPDPIAQTLYEVKK